MLAILALSFGNIATLEAGLLDDLLGSGSSSCASSAPSCIGAFAPPIAEPTIGNAVTTAKCIPDSQGDLACKPAAGTLTALHDGRFLYFNALEGTENIELSILVEFGQVAVNDQTRVLSFGPNDAPTWIKPFPNDAGANPGGSTPTPIIPGGINTGTDGADGALFCADVVQLADGRIMAVGGTDYYSEPGINGFPLGLTELEGLKNARIFDPATNLWTQTGSMNFGRWYPTTVTLPNSDVFVASGVTKLLKPVYPQAPLQSGRNVVQSETFSAACATWSDNGGLAQRSLPLFPRLHLLPNGHVYYNANGQAFNPFGEAYDQALWNVVGTYDPSTKQWSDLGVAGLPLQLNRLGLEQLTAALNPTNPNILQSLLSTLVGVVSTDLDDLTRTLSQVMGFTVDRRVVEKTIGAGMRGSTFSIMLPLEPEASGRYQKARFLTAGGVLSGFAVGSPGLFFATDSSRIDTVDTSNSTLTYSSQLTGRLNSPRWYGSGVLLPDGSVMTFSGADRDGVVLPGLERPLRQAERFDPVTQKWKVMATAHQPRTYHNTAVLMPDGRVLIGGHAPITTAYLFHADLSSLGLAPNDGRDPSLEIYSPPYVYRTDRPVIANATGSAVGLNRGQLHTIQTGDASKINTALLIRYTDTTHLVDADQRAVKLPIVGRSSSSVQVRIPEDAAVLPAGHYMLFISKTDSNGTVVPSKSTPIRINAAPGVCSVAP
jgi:hypothetical protein